MAKGRKVVSDVSSEEVDALRRTVHTLMLVLRGFADDLSNAAAASNINNVGAGLRDAIDNGVDSAGTDYTGTNLLVEGVVPTPKHPKRRQSGTVVDLDSQDL